MDGKPGIFPLYPSGPMQVKPASTQIPQFAGHSTFDDRGRQEYLEVDPIAVGKTLVLAPEDPERHVTIRATIGDLMLLDGRNVAQNGWLVVRSLIPAKATGKVAEWSVRPHSIEGWKRSPVIGFSQAGYHPTQKKVAVIELDPSDTPLETASVFEVTAEGASVERLKAKVQRWGRYLRYNYALVDFSSIEGTGLFFIQYGGQRTDTFPIGAQVYRSIWHQTLDVWFPVQMDHMFVNEAYRVWHGAAHLDDARQAPPNTQHFDGYDPGLAPYESNGQRSGTPDDRWAFTNKSAATNYGSSAALAAASRALRGYNDALAQECLAAAKKAWNDERQASAAAADTGMEAVFRQGAELTATLQLLITTKERQYADRFSELIWPALDRSLGQSVSAAVRALPYLDTEFGRKLLPYIRKYKKEIDGLYGQNPYGVPIGTRGWAGNEGVISWAVTNYHLHKAYPDLIGPEYVVRGLNYVLGCHPASNVSFVSGVGTRSKKVAYGNNRADFTFIAGGVVPGVLILKPDFPENKEDWPFLWGENEYVIDICADYIFLANAVNDLLREESRD